ncbi:riboflavin synthase [Lacrimispora sp. JR3]|uniref:riboflavin synthase n=1 Tax=Lacrimispora sinapis TaxID=3111456 RepID=UPI0037499527
MFTGIIEEIGTVRGVKKGAYSAVLTVGASLILKDIKAGDSICVNGICLTVTSFTATAFTADVMHETLRRSSLARLCSGSTVNLERAMPANGRFGGHILTGHIDGTGIIRSIDRDDNAIWYTIRTTPGILRYIVEKGSIGIDGISLTVARLSKNDFGVSVIPHTAKQTTLSGRRVGDTVNLENDCVGKYIEKFLGAAVPSKGTPKYGLE